MTDDKHTGDVAVEATFFSEKYDDDALIRVEAHPGEDPKPVRLELQTDMGVFGVRVTERGAGELVGALDAAMGEVSRHDA